MSKIQLYIAVTIDGFIAREDGSLDWLDAVPNPNKLDYGYYDFIAGVDTVVIGRKTYDEVLSFDVGWPYSDCKSYVVSSNKNYQIKTDNTFLLNSVDKNEVERVKNESKKNIWLIGGGELITHFLNMEAVDEMILSVIPIILGKGIRLFPDEPKETNFELKSTEAFENGIVNLSYVKK